MSYAASVERTFGVAPQNIPTKVNQLSRDVENLRGDINAINRARAESRNTEREIKALNNKISEIEQKIEAFKPNKDANLKGAYERAAKNIAILKKSVNEVTAQNKDIRDTQAEQISALNDTIAAVKNIEVVLNEMNAAFNVLDREDDRLEQQTFDLYRATKKVILEITSEMEETKLSHENVLRLLLERVATLENVVYNLNNVPISSRPIPKVEGIPTI